VLVVLKFKTTGCAAGGDIVHVPDMHRQGLSKRRRKLRIQRNWNVQTVFGVVSMAMPVLSFLGTNRGVDPVVDSFPELTPLLNGLQAVAYQGMAIARRVQSLVDDNQDLMQTAVACQSLQDLQLSWNATLYLQVDDMTVDWRNALEEAVQVTQRVQDVLAWLDAHDWLLRLLLLVLNIINAFFLVGVFLTKNQIDYRGLQQMTAHILLPLFSLLTVATILASAVAGMGATLHSDVCTHPWWEQSTSDNRIQQGLRQYFDDECMPPALPKLDDLNATLQDALVQFEELPVEECPNSMAVNATLDQMKQVVVSLQMNLHGAQKLASCETMHPFAQDLQYGTLCDEALAGSASAFGFSFSLAVCCMILWTTRAALFNPLVRARRRKRRAKEFEEYKDYMSEYYDTKEWVMDPPGLVKLLQTDSSSSEEQDVHQQQEVQSPLSTTSEDVQLALGPEMETPTSHDNIEIVYYSSDSDDDDEPQDELSLAQSFSSHVSNIVSSVWSGGPVQRASEQRKQQQPQSPTSGRVFSDESASPTNSAVERFVGRLKRLRRLRQGEQRREQIENALRQCETPNVTQATVWAQEQRQKMDPLNLGFCQHTTAAFSDDELDVLTPRAPRKQLQQLSRTRGGSQRGGGGSRHTLHQVIAHPVILSPTEESSLSQSTSSSFSYP